MNLTELNESSHCVYFSCPERSISPAIYLLLYISAAAVALLTVFGNLLVIISVSFFKQLHTPTNMILLSLAVSDFLVGLFVMPFHFMLLIESCWIFGHIFCIMFNFICFQLTSVSVGNVVLIAVDRYVALSHPFLYLKETTSTVVNTLISLIWMCSFLYSFLFFCMNENFADLSMCPGECTLNYFNEVSVLIDLLLTIMIPCSVMVILYSKVFVIVRRHANAIRERNKDMKNVPENGSEGMKYERKAAKVLGILVFVFLACLLPFYICSLTSTTEASYLMIDYILILFYLNSLINPLIYALFYSWFQKCTKIILNCKILHTDSSFVNVL